MDENSKSPNAINDISEDLFNAIYGNQVCHSTSIWLTTLSISYFLQTTQNIFIKIFVPATS